MRIEIISKANALAEEEYQVELKNANEKATEVLNGLADKITEVATELVKGVVDGSC
jgi:hypothetical protein